MHHLLDDGSICLTKRGARCNVKKIDAHALDWEYRNIIFEKFRRYFVYIFLRVFRLFFLFTPS